MLHIDFIVLIGWKDWSLKISEMTFMHFFCRFVKWIVKSGSLSYTATQAASTVWLVSVLQ